MKFFDTSNLRGDIYGGLTAGVVALPLALAFGEASGAGPIAGVPCLRNSEVTPHRRRYRERRCGSKGHAGPTERLRTVAAVPAAFASSRRPCSQPQRRDGGCLLASRRSFTRCSTFATSSSLQASPSKASTLAAMLIFPANIRAIFPRTHRGDRLIHGCMKI